MAALPSTSVKRLRPERRRSHGRRGKAPQPVVRRHQLVLVANGSASGLDRDGVERVAAAMRSHGAAVETRVTANLGELAAVWREAAGRRVVLLGGDGSVHAAANLPGPRPELALVPAGRANNIAHSLGIPLDRAAAAQLAVEGSARRIDMIEATSPHGRRLAVEGASAGLHAIARSAYSAPNSADLRAGARVALAAARRFRGVSLLLESDGTRRTVDVGQLFVANMPLFAFGLRVAPDARPDDGLLDLVTIDWSGRAALLPALARLRSGDHIRRDGVRSWRARHVRISSGGESPVIADTSNLGSGWVDLQARPGALALVAPKR